MSDNFRSCLFCSSHNSKFSSSSIMKHLNTGPHHSISKIFMFKDKIELAFFQKKSKSTKFYLIQTKILNHSTYMKMIQEPNNNSVKMREIYEKINNFIEEWLNFISDFEGKKHFYQSQLERIERIMSHKLKLVIDYEYFKDFNIQSPEFLNQLYKNYYRSSFCNRKLISSFIAYPLCGVLLENNKYLIVGCGDSTIKWIKLENKSISFTLCQNSQSNTLTLYDLERKLISCCENGSIYVWNIQTKKIIKTIKDYESPPIEDSDLNLNKTLFLTSDKLQVIKIWILNSWEKKYIFRAEESIYPMYVRFLQYDTFASLCNNYFDLYLDGGLVQRVVSLGKARRIDVSKNKSFFILLLIENSRLCKITMNNFEVEEITKDNCNGYQEIRLSNSDKYLIALRKLNASIINLDTKAIVEVIIIPNIIIPFALGYCEFLLVNQYYSLQYIENVPNIVIRTFKANFNIYDAEKYEIDKRAGIIHLLNYESYITFNIITKSITRYKSNHFSSISLVPSSGAVILGNELGDVIIKIRNHEKQIFTFNCIINMMRESYLNNNQKIPTFFEFQASETSSSRVSHSEKYLALGFRYGLVVILNLETESVHDFYLYDLEFITTIYFSQSDRFIVSNCRSGLMCIYNIESKSKLCFKKETQRWMIRVILSLDERYLLYLFRSRVINIYDTLTQNYSKYLESQIDENHLHIDDIKRLMKK